MTSKLLICTLEMKCICDFKYRHIQLLCVLCWRLSSVCEHSDSQRCHLAWTAFCCLSPRHCFRKLQCVMALYQLCQRKQYTSCPFLSEYQRLWGEGLVLRKCSYLPRLLQGNYTGDWELWKPDGTACSVERNTEGLLGDSVTDQWVNKVWFPVPLILCCRGALMISVLV